MNGLICDYKINKEYFKPGECYQIRLDTDEYKNCICAIVSNTHVTFGYLNGLRIELLILDIDDLRFKDQDIVKLIPDYRHGKFEYINDKKEEIK